MNEINFESKGEKLYVVKLDDTAIGRLLKNKEGSWKITLGVLKDQDLYTLLNSLNKEPCESGASPLLRPICSSNSSITAAAFQTCARGS